ncbi:hypothetical protein [Clostridium sp. YIM B02569]|uniref:hypothetical protein n=1 Tax=Clostridium sp. YIM B02569 TaxID=2911967 RepID=UPI001EEF0781|nr:hypothetical protein [Clostridium sp. YIM B02569]
MLNNYYKNYKAEAWDILQYLFKAKRIAMLEKVFGIFPYKIARGIIEKKFVNPPIAFTNIGIIDEKQLAFDDIEII